MITFSSISPITLCFIVFILFFMLGFFLYYLTHKNKFELPIIPIMKKSMPIINPIKIIYCEREWICTSCMWSGKYKDTIPVMYHGNDWQNCPSCNTVAIPMEKK